MLSEGGARRLPWPESFAEKTGQCRAATVSTLKVSTSSTRAERLRACFLLGEAVPASRVEWGRDAPCEAKGTAPSAATVPTAMLSTLGWSLDSKSDWFCSDAVKQSGGTKYGTVAVLRVRHLFPA